MGRFIAGEVAGPGVVLRPLVLDDVGDIVDACRDGLTQRWLPLPRSYDADDARWFVEEFAAGMLREGSGIVFAIDARTEPDLARDRRLLGAIDLKGTDWSTHCTETGYWVAPWARRRGVATRAVRRLGEWALRERGLERVVLRAAVGNAPSRAVAQRAGYVAEGVERNAGVVHDGRVDLAVYSLVPEDLR